MSWEYGKKWADKEIAMMPSASQQNGILLSREVILLSNTQRGSVMDSWEPLT